MLLTVTLLIYGLLAACYSGHGLSANGNSDSGIDSSLSFEGADGAPDALWEHDVGDAAQPPGGPYASLTITHTVLLAPGLVVTDLHCFDRKICVAIDTDGRVLRTTDSGSHWDIQDIGAYRLNYLTCPTPTRCILGGSGVWTSSDSGVSWIRQTLPPEWDDFVESISCMDDVECLAVGDTSGSILRTQDCGSSWEILATTHYAASDAVACNPDRHCIMLNRYQAPFASVDGGETWQPASPNQLGDHRHTAAHCWPGKCLAISMSGIWMSADGGINWQSTTDNLVLDVFGNDISCPAPDACFGKVITVNGGESWYPLYPSLPTEAVSCPTLDFCIYADSDRFYIAENLELHEE